MGEQDSPAVVRLNLALVQIADKNFTDDEVALRQYVAQCFLTRTDAAILTDNPSSVVWVWLTQ